MREKKRKIFVEKLILIWIKEFSYKNWFTKTLVSFVKKISALKCVKRHKLLNDKTFFKSIFSIVLPLPEIPKIGKASHDRDSAGLKKIGTVTCSDKVRISNK